MKKTVILLLLLCTFSLQGAINTPWNRAQPQILVNNRILVEVGGKPISVMDVVKKMDMYFYERYPQYSNIPQARYEFYTVNWTSMLQELIDKELILDDAKKMNVTVNVGEVRKELERLFGPNIIDNLERANLTYEDALQMIRDDLTMRKIMGFRVNSKAIRQITPQMIRAEYQTFASENIAPPTWTYYVITVSNETEKLGKEASSDLYRELTKANVSLETLQSWLKSSEGQFGSSKITLSSPQTHSEETLSEQYKPILKELAPHTFSHPFEQMSRARGQNVYRIFYVEAVDLGGAPPFSDVEIKLKEKLVREAVNKETSEYLAKMRKLHKMEDEVETLYPDNFQPFILKN